VVLSSAVSRLGGRVTPGGLVWVNRVSGLILVGFAVAALLSVVL
jgi:hypothetical protein